MATAKVFWSEQGQAIRLPREVRFPRETEVVEVHREGDRIVLVPIHREEWPASFWDAFGSMPADFERPRQVRQERETHDP